MGGSAGIEGREYKLLLDPRMFSGAPDDNNAQRFWNERLKPIIESKIGAKDDGSSRAKGELTVKEQRVVVFFDTKERLLTKTGFALRQRSDVKNGQLSDVPEVTLKFRSPDVRLSAGYGEFAKARNPATKLEEDIAPLEAPRKGKPPAVADPPSTYSRFSVSTKVDVADDFSTMADVCKRFDMLGDYLDHADDDAIAKMALWRGPTICEFVFKDAAVDLGKGVNGKFALSLWYFLGGPFDADGWARAAAGKMVPRVAEISYDFDIPSNGLERSPTMRALKLFIEMQKTLPGDSEASSKTALALPPEA